MTTVRQFLSHIPLAVALALGSVQAFAVEKVALVIGNQSYKEQSLRNPGNDAQDMSNALEKLGFKVTLLQDADLRQMKEAVRAFGNDLQGSDVGLFFYAGHGVQANGANYLVPVKSDIQSVTDLEYSALDVGFVMDYMDKAGSKLSIVVLDACRNNPFRGLRSGTRGLLNMSGPTGSIIAFATAPNNTAEDGRGRNGVYTKHILENLNTPGIGIEEMFKRVRIGVTKETQGRQTPWENSSLSSEFCFAGCEKPKDVAESKEMERIRKQNEQLAAELEKMRTEQRSYQARMDELRTMKSKKEELEKQIESDSASRKQEFQEQLAAVLREKQELEQALKARDKNAESQRTRVDELDRVGKEKERLEAELKRYEQADQLRQQQVDELKRNKDMIKKLEEEVRRYAESAQFRNSRIVEMESIKSENERLLTSLKEKDRELKASQSALSEAKRKKGPSEEDVAPLIVNP